MKDRAFRNRAVQGILLLSLLLGAPGALGFGSSEGGRDGAATAASPPEAPTLRRLGRWYAGPTYSSAVSGDYVYYGSGGTIHALKIDADGSWQKQEVSITIEGVVRELFASESHLYVADESGGLRIIDISDPLQLREVGRTEEPAKELAPTAPVDDSRAPPPLSHPLVEGSQAHAVRRHPEVRGGEHHALLEV